VNRRGGRAAALVVVAVVAVATAVGPGRLAAAFPTAPTAGPAGFLPAPTPVRVTAPTLRIIDLRAIVEDQPIALAGGGRSPRGSAASGGTVLLRFARIELDNLTIGGSQAGAYALAITNSGAAAQAATIGGPGGGVELWGVLHHLEVCLPHGSLPGAAGACPEARALFPALGALVRSGSLPRTIEARNLDLDLYALRATAAGSVPSLSLPAGRVVVQPK